MKVFIDVGAYDGDSIEQFYNWFKLYDDPTKYQVWGFEPSPKYEELVKKHEGRSNIYLNNTAAWLHDGYIDLAVDDIGSTVMRNKTNYKDAPKISVKCFDFSTFLKRFSHDHVVIKMDCEGAEFPILEKMLADGTIKIPDLMMIEFHPNKVTNYTTTYKDELVERIKEFTEVVEWH